MLPDSDCNKETIAHRWLEGTFAMFVTETIEREMIEFVHVVMKPQKCR